MTIAASLSSALGHSVIIVAGGGDEKEIAAMVAWFASDSAAYVIGQTIGCDGGGFMGL